MWHNNGKEEIVCKNKEDLRAGTYLVYDVDTFDYLLNDIDWVANNNAFDERDYILDYLDMMLESEDGKIIYIPDAKTAIKIETQREIQYYESTRI